MTQQREPALDEFAGVDKVPVRFHRIARAIAVGLAGAYGWGVRGIFGHELGAAIPGVLIGATLALLSGHDLFRRRQWVVAATGAVGFAIGGSMSYGLLVGYTRHVHTGSVLYGFLGLLLVGALWGLIGGAWIGLALARAITLRRLLDGAAVMMGAAASGYGLLVSLLGLHLSPPRSDAWAAVLGAALGLSWLLRRWGVPAGWGGAIFGAFGFGLGFVFGDALQTLGGISGLAFDWWKVMEVTMGFCGGTALAWGIWLMADLGRPLLRSPNLQEPGYPLATRLVVWALIFLWVPAGIALTRFSPKALSALAEGLGFQPIGPFVGMRQWWAWAAVAVGILATVRWLFSQPSRARQWARLLPPLFALQMLFLAALRSLYPGVGPIPWRVLVLLAGLLLAGIVLAAFLEVDARVFHLHPPKPTARFVGSLAVAAVVVTVAVSLLVRFSHSTPLPGAHLRW
jgi:hypothetical protein